MIGARDRRNQIVPALRIAAGQVRQGPVRHVVPADGIDAIRRDDVAREGQPFHTPVRSDERGCRIVDAGAGQQGGEIAVAHRLGRHRERVRGRRGLAQPFVGDEEEQAVLAAPDAARARQHHRTAERRAPAVVAQGVLPAAAVGVPFAVRVRVDEELVGRERLVTVEPVRRTGRAVGTAARDDVDVRPGGMALLGVEARGDDLELVDGFRGGHVRDLTAERRVVGQAVERELTRL